MRIKKLIAGIAASALMLPTFSCLYARDVQAAVTDVTINEAHFPDENFRSYVSSNIDINKDNILQVNEILNCKRIFCSNMEIESMVGIQYFTQLEILNCSQNQITSINLNTNRELVKLYCSDNQLASLELKNNSKLLELVCFNNEFTSLELSGTPNILNLCTTTALESSQGVISAIGSVQIDGADCLVQINIDDDVTLTNRYRPIEAAPEADPTPSEEPSEVPSVTDVPSGTPEEQPEDGPTPTPTYVPTPTIEPNPDFFCYWDSSEYSDGDGYNYLNSPYIHLVFGAVNEYRGSIYYKVYRGNELVYTGPVSNNQMATGYYGNGYGEPEVLNEWLIEGVYTINYYSANGTFLTGASVDVFNTFVPTPTPEPAATGMEGFAERLYTCALMRDFDISGKEYWVSQLRNGVTGATAAQGFFFSVEISNANISDEEFITRLYLTFMDREPAEEEVAYWSDCMVNGAVREDVFSGFINSEEWANICLTYGIRSGGSGVPSIVVEPSESIIDFATRLYTTCLGRDADQEGLDYWASELANLRISGSRAAYEYFFSEEFTSAAYDDTEYINRLYRTFMNREAGEAEISYWSDSLSNGSTREDVFNGFAASNEFGRICLDYGILR